MEAAVPELRSESRVLRRDKQKRQSLHLGTPVQPSRSKPERDRDRDRDRDRTRLSRRARPQSTSCLPTTTSYTTTSMSPSSITTTTCTTTHTPPVTTTTTTSSPKIRRTKSSKPSMNEPLKRSGSFCVCLFVVTLFTHQSL